MPQAQSSCRAGQRMPAYSNATATAVCDVRGRRGGPTLATEKNVFFFLPREAPAGKQTSPSGRFLRADLPKDEKVILDSNKPYTPPCAFPPYATSPPPPPQNR